MAFCANCGSQVSENVAFCPSCGKATGQAGPTAPPQPTAPPPAAGASYQAAAPVSNPLEENIAGMLAYFTIIPAIVFLLIEPYNRNRFVRFHSFQSLFFFVGGGVVVPIVLAILSTIFHLVPAVGWMVSTIMWMIYDLGFFVLWLLLVIKAYQHEIFKLPIVGDMAEKQAGA